MKKPFKVMSATAVTSAIAAAAVVPTQVAAADETSGLSGLVFEQNDGQQVSVTYDAYFDAVIDMQNGTDNPVNDVISDDNGNIKIPTSVKIGTDFYNTNDFTDVFVDNEDVTLEEAANNVTNESTPLPEEETSEYEEYNEEISVESVSAINDTSVEVELNSEIGEDDTLPTFTFDGSAVAEENITVDGSTVTLSGLSIQDDSENPDGYNLTVTDTEGEELYNDTVVYDANELTTLSTDSGSSFNATVGEEASVTYTLENEDEEPMAEENIRVRATDDDSNSVVEEQTLTTDENGQVTFSYSQVDGGSHSISAVALSKPTLRDNSVNVDWVETTASISVNNPESAGVVIDGTLNSGSSASNVSSEDQTATYTATFQDENGDLVDSEAVYAYVESSESAYINDAGDFGIGETISAGAGSLYEASTNSDGEAVLELTSKAATELDVTFYYAGGESGITDVNNFDSSDARINANSLEVVDGDTQEASLDFALADDDTLNQNVSESDSGYEVVDGSDLTYQLTAEDQYGNPYIGEADINHDVLADDLAGNDGDQGSITLNVQDEDGSTVTNTSGSTYDFSSENGDGIVNVVASAGNVNDSTQVVVYADEDGDDVNDSDESSNTSEEVTFVDAEGPESISMSLNDDAVVGTSTPVTYSAGLKDAEGNDFGVSSDQNVVIELYKDGEKIDQSVGSNATVTSTSGTSSDSQVGENHTAVVNDSNGEFSFDVTPGGSDEGSNISAVVTVDENDDGVINSDENITVEGAAFDVVPNPSDYNLELSSNEVTAGETVDVTVNALDGSDNVLSDFNGTFTTKVNVGDDASSPAKTYLRDAEFVDGTATVSVPVTAEIPADGNLDVQVSLDPAASGTPSTVNIDGDNDSSADTNDGDITVNASTASELSTSNLDGTAGAPEELYVSDAYGNLVDYDYTGLATVTIDGDAELQDASDASSVALTAEDQVSLSIENGELKVDGNYVQLSAGSDSEADTLTVDLQNGDSFSVTAN